MTRPTDHLRELLERCLPVLAGNPRSYAQEILADVCDELGYDPFDLTHYPDVLASRLNALGRPDRRRETR